jgi:hypothetical protein
MEQMFDCKYNNISANFNSRIKYLSLGSAITDWGVTDTRGVCIQLLTV